MRLICLFVSSLFVFPLMGQLPETDIFLCTVKKDSSGYIFSNPENITDREGYDNQPSFTPDNKKILYTAVTDSLQSDIYSYDIELKVSFQFTSTVESEYSPAYAPDNRHISVVRVDADSAQRFYKLPLNDKSNATLVKNTDGIGYACTLNDSLLAMFILGKAHTLQVLNMKNSERKLIASNIGRCMKLSPDKSKMYFVLKSNPAEWFIYSMKCSDFSLTRIAKTLDGSEDFAVFPDDTFVMGNKGKLYQLENSNDWKEIADFSNELKDFYRITISNDGFYIALVAFAGQKP